MSALGNASQYAKHPAVHLSGIGLAGHGIAALKAHLLSNLLIQSAAALMVAVKEL